LKINEKYKNYFLHTSYGMIIRGTKEQRGAHDIEGINSGSMACDVGKGFGLSARCNRPYLEKINEKIKGKINGQNKSKNKDKDEEKK
jgi:hypothetical protein